MKKLIILVLTFAMVLGITACGGAEAKSVDLQQIYSTYESTLPAMMVLDEGTMMNFLGISAEDCTQVVAAICADGLRADEVWLIEAKDTAALEKLTNLANTRLAAKMDETISYNPEQYLVCEQGVVLTEGLYLAFLVSPDVDTFKASFEAAFN